MSKQTDRFHELRGVVPATDDRFTVCALLVLAETLAPREENRSFDMLTEELVSTRTDLARLVIASTAVLDSATDSARDGVNFEADILQDLLTEIKNKQ